MPRRIFALSDIHTDFPENAEWLSQLSQQDYRDDVLILAGDVADSLRILTRSLSTLVTKFHKVLFVPGNHDLWVIRDGSLITSFDKFEQVRIAAREAGASMETYSFDGLRIVPLLGWYDYSFGQPETRLLNAWMDYAACRWPEGFEPQHVAAYFARLNVITEPAPGEVTISFSHFLPRIDVMPPYVPEQKRFLYPVLGSAALDHQVRALKSTMHVYGHSHINRRIEIDGVTYVNNAFGYPQETRIAAKQMLHIHTT